MPQLRLVPGIAEVNIYGGALQTYEVQVDPDRLRAQGITLPQVYAAIESNNATRGGASIYPGDEQQIVRGLALVQGVGDIAGIVLKAAPGGIPVTVSARVGGELDDFNCMVLAGSAGEIELRDWFGVRRRSAGAAWESLGDAAELRARGQALQLTQWVEMIAGRAHGLPDFAEALAVQRTVESLLALA